MPVEKTEFENTTDGTIGVVVILPGGKEQGLPLVSHATVWLTEDDQMATANAPKLDSDNPFLTGALRAVGVPKGLKNRRPIGTPQEESSDDAEQRAEAEKDALAEKDARDKAAAQQRAENEARQKAATEQAVKGGARPAAAKQRQSAEETGAPPQPQGKAAEGSRASGEEVGTPEAAKAS